MNTPKTLLASTLALTTLALTALMLSPVSASAHATREFISSFGSFQGPTGLAVDQETGNVYVSDPKTQTIDVFNATGGPPVDGVPTQITGVTIEKGDGPSGVAVDNSCYEHEPRLTGVACEEFDPSYGDVYVIKRPTSGGSAEGYGIKKFKLNPGVGYELVELLPLSGNDTPYGVTVDSRGNIYSVSYFESPVTEFKKVVEKITSGGKEEIEEKLEEVTIPESLEEAKDELGPDYVAVDDSGDLYISDGYEGGGLSEGFRGVAKLKLNGSGGVVSEEIFVANMVGYRRPLAVDPSTGAVFVGAGSEIAEYDSAGALQLKFGSTEPLGGSLGIESQGPIAIAVNDATDRVYVANTLHGEVDVFGPVLGPPVFEGEQPPASSIARTSALIAGTVNPESGGASDYFEYVAAGEYEPQAPEPYREGGRTAIEPLAGGHTPETVQRVVLTGLKASTTYHYRMVASNANATTYGPDETFTTAAATPPVASTGPAGEVSATGVTLTGVVAPQGLATSYVFEVGTDTGYGGAKLFGNAGSSTGEVAVSVGLQYLVPGTVYHYRLAATNFDGTSYGQDATFTTPGVPSSVVQPSSAPLIASPVVQFPSVTSAITSPVAKKSKPGKASKGARKLAGALRACRKQKPGARRASCEARARKLSGRAGKTNHSKKG
jgi:DNA-binding beta-propeller fold protein YncE